MSFLPHEQIQQKENSVNVKQVLERSKRQAARIARDKLKEIFSHETFFLIMMPMKESAETSINVLETSGFFLNLLKIRRNF